MQTTARSSRRAAGTLAILLVALAPCLARAAAPPCPLSTSPVRDVLIQVQEDNTGSLLFGVGVNSDSGLTGSVVLNERDFDVVYPPADTAFRGAGQEMRIRCGAFCCPVPVSLDTGFPVEKDREANEQVFSFWLGLFQ